MSASHSASARAQRRTRARGQAMVEFVLLAPMLMVMVLSLVDLAWFFQDQVTMATITRDGARYAATHPTSWDSAANAKGNSIQGIMQQEQGPLAVTNQDNAGATAGASAITIKYFDCGTSGTPRTCADPASATTPSQCGHYQQAATSGWKADNSYTQANCVKVGNIVEIDLTFNYHVQAPSNAIPIQQTLVEKYAEVIVQ